MSAAILVEDLAKQYRIDSRRLRHRTLREAMVQSMAAPVRRIRHGGAYGSQRVLALEGVYFEIHAGEAVGIIGRNGAGKSTLLKILARITEPTQGRVRIVGRVGSLLEVGSGFHSELTGRENVYLNGAILGMTKSDITARFDDIVEFAGVGRYIDTPIKRFSSGMRVRLAFAVAAHLEPEVLLVDEVLAVGDAEFQGRCIQRMEDITRGGRTILFVSHNMGAVQSLCRRGIVLDRGRVIVDASSEQAISDYLSTLEEASSVDLRERGDRKGRGEVRIVAVNVGGPKGRGSLATGMPATFSFAISQRMPGLKLMFTIYDHSGQPVANFNSRRSAFSDGTVEGLEFTCQIDPLLLVPGIYRIDADLVSEGVLQDQIHGVTSFSVETGRVEGRATASNGRFGSVYLPHRWTTPATGEADVP